MLFNKSKGSIVNKTSIEHVNEDIRMEFTKELFPFNTYYA